MEKRPEEEVETICEPEIEDGETPTCVSEACIGDRSQEYKFLILSIAECLAPDDVRKIVYIQNLPAEKLCQASALPVLQFMEKHGMMFDCDIRPLANVLKLINRHDLVNNYIKPYLSKYGRSPGSGDLHCHQFRARANAVSSMVSLRGRPECTCTCQGQRRYSDSQSRPASRQLNSLEGMRRSNSSPPDFLRSKETLKYTSTPKSPVSSPCTPKARSIPTRPSLNPIPENGSEIHVEPPMCNCQFRFPHIGETGRFWYPDTCCLLSNPANRCINPKDLELRPQQEQDDQCTIIVILTHQETPDELDLSETDTDSKVEGTRDKEQQTCSASKFQGQEILWLLQWKKHNEVVCESTAKTYLDVGVKKKPELTFKLYYSKNATLEIKLQIPTKCHLPSSANITLSVTLWECKAEYERLKLSSFTAEESMSLRQFSIFKFTTRTTLRESQTDYIEVHASAELTGLDSQS